MQEVSIYGKNKVFFRVLFIVLAVTVMALIFYFSNQNATRSIQTSSDLIIKLSRFFFANFDDKSLDQQQIIIDSLQFIVRKSAHFIIYCALGFNFCGLYSTFNLKKRFCFLFAVLSSAFYAATDEIHQYFIEGRSAEFRDVFIDSSGAVLGAAILLLILNIVAFIYKKRSKKGALV